MHGVIAVRSPKKVTENQFNDYDREPKQPFPTHSLSPLGEGTHDSLRTSAALFRNRNEKINPHIPQLDLRTLYSLLHGGG
jgi:hypothetical protein